MSDYFADVSWSTRASNVRMASLPYRYLVDVNPLDPNEPGSYPMIVESGDWFIDYSGYPFLIEEVNGNTITVYDINERGNGQTSAYGPYSNMIGYVYRPKNNGFLLTQAQLRKLDSSAADVIQNIERGIIWKFRGVKITKDGESSSNVTEIELVNIDVEESTDSGWQGGSKLKLIASAGGANSFEVTQNNHGFDNDFIYHDGTSWQKAVASSETTCSTHFAVRIDDNKFKAYSSGDVEVTFLDDQGDSLVDGEYYFLSQTVPGKVSRTMPTSGLIQSVMVKTSSGITISIHEPYEYVGVGGGSLTFIGLTDTPSSYTNGKFLYTDNDSIIFKDIAIQDVANLSNVLSDKASLSSSNTFSGANTFGGSLSLTGITESTKTKILYIDPTTKQVSYGNAPSGGSGTPGGNNMQVQYNDDGAFAGAPIYYDNINDTIGIGTYPSETAYIDISPSPSFLYDNYPIVRISTGWGSQILSIGSYKTVLSPIENDNVSDGLVLSSINRNSSIPSQTGIILKSRGFFLNGNNGAFYNSMYISNYTNLLGNRAKFAYGFDDGITQLYSKTFINELSLYRCGGSIDTYETMFLKQYLTDSSSFEYDYEIFAGYGGCSISADLYVYINDESQNLKYINSYKIVESKRDDSGNEVQLRLLAIPYRIEYQNIEIVSSFSTRYEKMFYTIGIKNNNSTSISVYAFMVVSKIIFDTWIGGVL